MLTSERQIITYTLNKFSRKGFQRVFLLLSVKIIRGCGMRESCGEAEFCPSCVFKWPCDLGQVT